MEPSGSELRRVRRELAAFRIAVAAASSATRGHALPRTPSNEFAGASLIAALGGESEPVASAEPIRELLAVGAPDFEAHGLNTPRPEERLQLLLLTSTAAADELRAAAHRA